MGDAAAEAMDAALGWIVPPLAPHLRRRTGKRRSGKERSWGWRKLLSTPSLRRNLLSTGAPLVALTRRERDVANFVAWRLTNRQIAAQLVISEHTAATHVAWILKKLGLNSCLQLSAWVTAQGLSSSDSG